MVRVNIAVCTQAQKQDAYRRAYYTPPSPAAKPARLAARGRGEGYVYVLASAYIISLHSAGV